MNLKRLLTLGVVAGLFLAPRAVAAPADSLSFRDNSERLAKILTDSIDPGDPGAALMVLRDGHVVLQRCLGTANLATGEKIDEHTRFYIASLAKTITATAILLLHESDKLGLEDRVDAYFPDVPALRNGVRIYHLLTHTSGLPGSTGETPEDRPITNESVIDFVKALDALDFEPGVDYRYSNVAYVLLAEIVEKVSGMRYRDFVAKNILSPLGMNETVVFDETRPEVPRKAIGYEIDGDSYAENDYRRRTVTGPGGIYSSLHDLRIWHDAIQQKRILTPRSWKLAFHMPVTLSGAESWMAMGWFNETFGRKTPDLEGVRAYGAIGSLNGFRAMMKMFPEHGLSFIVLSNSGRLPVGGTEVARTYLVKREDGEDRGGRAPSPPGAN